MVFLTVKTYHLRKRKCRYREWSSFLSILVFFSGEQGRDNDDVLLPDLLTISVATISFGYGRKRLRNAKDLSSLEKTSQPATVACHDFDKKACGNVCASWRYSN
jgi:hypothetical protein